MKTKLAGSHFKEGIMQAALNNKLLFTQQTFWYADLLSLLMINCFKYCHFSHCSFSLFLLALVLGCYLGSGAWHGLQIHEEKRRKGTMVENHCTYCKVELAISLPSNSELQTYDKLPCGYRRQQASLAYSWGTFVSHSMTQFHRAFPSPYFSFCLFHFLSVLHLPPCSFSCSDCYFSLIVSSEPCSLPLKWQLFTYLRLISKPYKGWPPITSNSSSAFSFAHTKANHFQEGIARGLCHRLHIFSVLWTPQQKKLTAMQ